MIHRFGWSHGVVNQHGMRTCRWLGAALTGDRIFTPCGWAEVTMMSQRSPRAIEHAVQRGSTESARFTGIPGARIFSVDSSTSRQTAFCLGRLLWPSSPPCLAHLAFVPPQYFRELRHGRSSVT